MTDPTAQQGIRDQLDSGRPATDAQAPLSQPIPAPADSGAIGRLNEAESEQVERAVCTLGKVECDVLGHDHSRHLNRLIPLVERIVREHTDRALAEVEQRIKDAPNFTFTLLRDRERALDIVRAARQEQGR